MTHVSKHQVSTPIGDKINELQIQVMLLTAHRSTRYVLLVITVNYYDLNHNFLILEKLEYLCAFECFSCFNLTDVINSSIPELKWVCLKAKQN